MTELLQIALGLLLILGGLLGAWLFWRFRHEWPDPAARRQLIYALAIAIVGLGGGALILMKGL